jgi:transcriptional regulator with XRE-family HTH domain
VGDFNASEFDRYIGHRLRQERRLAGMSRSVLGEVIGADIETVEKYEKGGTRMTADHLAKAMATFDLSA